MAPHDKDPDEGNAAVQKPGLRRRMRVLLIASLTLNLLFLGMLAGAMLSHGGRPPHVREVSFGPYTDALSREDRAALRQAFLEQAPGVRTMRRTAQADFQRLLAALRAEPHDVATTRDVIIGQQRRTAERLEIGQSLLLARIEAMPPEARLAFADRLEAALKNPRKSPDARRSEESRP